MFRTYCLCRLTALRLTRMVLLTSVLIFAAQVITASDHKPDAPDPKDTGKCFLWKVTSPTSTAYLMGSVHVARKDLYPLDNAFYEGWNDSAVLVVEADAGNADASMMLQMQSKAMLPAGRKLQEMLKPETRKLLSEYERSSGTNLTALPMQPWFLAMTITLTEAQKHGFVAEYGIDMHFLNKARSEGKAVAELEGLAFQMNLLTGFTQREQDLFLRMTLMEASELEENMERMMQAWKWGDADYMEYFAENSLKKNPELLTIYKKMFFERNDSMTKKISRYLTGKRNFFVVVGAAHLVGKRGIVQLLSRNPKLKVEQVGRAKADKEAEEEAEVVAQ